MLWQLRHSIVHTAGTIGRPDAQKVPDLASFGNHEIVAPPTFIDATARRLHRVVRGFAIDLKDKSVRLRAAPTRMGFSDAWMTCLSSGRRAGRG